MFTGIVEEIGTIKNITTDKNSFNIEIESKICLNEINIGDSIAVNGVCLTVCKISKNSFTADVMPETINKTSLSLLSKSSFTNLERALTLNKRLGGHIVSGHIDGVGKIISKTNDKNALWLEIETTSDILKYIIQKGSVTLDGTSLTVSGVNSNSFKVSLIPHTRKMSIIGDKKIGDIINIECDIVGKYIEKFIINNLNESAKKDSPKNNITLDLLSRNGFL